MSFFYSSYWICMCFAYTYFVLSYKIIKMSLFNIPIELYRDEDIYIAKCNLIQWAFASWNTPQEAMSELEDVIAMLMDQNQTISSNFIVNTNKIFTYLPMQIKWVYCDQ